MLTIGIPKNAHVLPGILRLLKAADLRPRSVTPSRIELDGLPGVELLVLKPKRLAILATRGRIDAAIAGEDVLRESGGFIETIGKLRADHFGLRRTRISLYVHKDDPASNIDAVSSGAKVLCEYVRIAHEFFAYRSDINLIESPGNTEAEIPRLYRFGVGVVDSGRSLQRHFLKEIETLCYSDPVLVRSGYMPISDEKRETLDSFAQILMLAIDRDPIPKPAALPDHTVFSR